MGSVKALTKTMLCRPSNKFARQGAKAANEGVYIDVNDRDLQPQSTQQAEFPPIGGNSAFVGF
jgi:hypothetical protein